MCDGTAAELSEPLVVSAAVPGHTVATQLLVLMIQKHFVQVKKNFTDKCGAKRSCWQLRSVPCFSLWAGSDNESHDSSVELRPLSKRQEIMGGGASKLPPFCIRGH